MPSCPGLERHTLVCSSCSQGVLTKPNIYTQRGQNGPCVWAVRADGGWEDSVTAGREGWAAASRGWTCLSIACVSSPMTVHVLVRGSNRRRRLVPQDAAAGALSLKGTVSSYNVKTIHQKASTSSRLGPASCESPDSVVSVVSDWCWFINVLS